MRISRRTTLLELAAIVSSTLEDAGIVATLSGGGAVSIYSHNRYESSDLDFVTAALVSELIPALGQLGFVHTGGPRLSVFEHPETEWYLEFPPAPLAFGSTYIDASDSVSMATPSGNLRIISPTQCVMDRLIAAASWQDAQSLEQAVLVATHQRDRVDWASLHAWVQREGIGATTEVVEFNRVMSPSRRPRK